MRLTLYHGSSALLEIDNNHPMFATADIKEAEEYALGLTDDGNYNEESYIYEIHVEGDVTEIEDFMDFDSIDVRYDEMPEIAHNQESGYYCIKHPARVRLIKHYRNNL